MKESERALVAVLPLTESELGQAAAANVRSVLATAADAEMRAVIGRGEVVEGMAAADVLRSWGAPKSSGRPWLITDGRGEWWRYEVAASPELEVWLRDGRLQNVNFRGSGSVPDVPQGEAGWVKCAAGGG